MVAQGQEGTTTLKSIVASYWQAGSAALNYGEALIPAILAHLGYHCVPDAPAYATLPHPRLMAISSELNRDHLQRLREAGKSVVIWGSSQGHGVPIPEGWASLRGVRGHLTRRALSLDENFPVGDPGFLVSTIFPFDPDRSGRPLWVPHIHNRGKTAASDWQADFGDVGVPISRLPEMVEKLARARFIFTNSLHVTITAIAYRVPFALCLGFGEQIDKPRKWEDLWSTLQIENGGLSEVPLRWCRSPREAEEWHATAGRYLRPPDLTAMLKAFPHDIAFESG